MSRVLDGSNQITQPYKSLSHKGIDLVKYKGQVSNILAHSYGKVVAVVKNYKTTDKAGSSYGNYVKIKHDNGYYTLYAHLKYGSVSVNVDDTVQKGQIIGFMGNTGHSQGAHLHFEVRNEKDIRIDPTPYIDASLPNATCVSYQVYDNKKNKWLSPVKSGSNDYAGNKGNGISGLKIERLEYQVHDKVKNRWLPIVQGNSDYAGNLPNDIDGIRIFNSNGYRVYDNVKKKFLPWVYLNEDYAGNLGHSIGAIQIK